MFLYLDDLKQPGVITATNVRKEVSSLSQLLNLCKSHLKCHSKFLGYDLMIHRQYYRLQNEAFRLAKFSRIMLAIDKGANQFKGMTPD